MTLNQLRYFLAVCNFRKFTVAAEFLHISEPSLSVSIRHLEEEFGYNLFIRDKKNLILTEQGEFFREQATKIINDFDHLEKEMLHFNADSPTIRVGITPTQTEGLLSVLIPGFIANYPSVHFETPYIHSRFALTMLEENELDFAIIFDFSFPFDESEWIFMPLYKVNTVGYVRNDHPLAGRKNVTPAEMENKPIVLMGQQSRRSAELIRWFQLAGIEPYIFMHSTHRSLSFSMILKNNVIAFLGESPMSLNTPSQFPPSGISSFTLKSPPEFTLGIARKRDAKINKYAEKFYDYCANYDYSNIHL